jgi:prepilin-type N-terminal cleavage/methylation domain-containing protein
MRRQRGFSLIELLFAAAIMVVVGGFGIFSLVGGRDSTMSRGLAQEIAEELKAARQQAISQQKPVAIAFPGGASCQAFYQLEGLSAPLVTRHIDYSETYPEACLFWGAWTGATVQPPSAQEVGAQYRLADWAPFPTTDPLLYFSPNGTVQGSNVALFSGGEYRLLVSNGVSGALGSTPAAVNKPWTVQISKTGAVAVTPGVVGLSVPDQPSLTVAVGADPVPNIAEPSGGLSFVELTTEPVPMEAPASGAYTVVPDEGYITLVARVDENKGEAPILWWTGSDGKFSCDRPVTMEYDFQARNWVSRMAWTPPPDAEPGNTFDLTCHVKNDDDEIEQGLGATTSVELARGERISSVNTDGLWENFYVAWMNSHGTNVVNLTLPDQVWEHLTPVWAPNGTKVAFYSGDFEPGSDPEGYEDFVATLYIVNEDGLYLRKLFSCVGDLTDYMFGPSFSPEGSYVTFSAYDASTNDASRVYVQRIYKINETNPYQCTTGGPLEEHTDVAWHPRGNLILYTYTKNTNDAGDADGIESSGIKGFHFGPDPTPPGGNFPDWDIVAPADDKQIGEAHWRFDGGQVVYTVREGDDFLDPKKLMVINTEPSGPNQGRPTSGSVDRTPTRSNGTKIDASSPRFSPEGDKIAVIDYATDDLWVVDASTGGAFRVTNIGEVYGYCWSPGSTKFIISTWDEKLVTVPATEGAATRDITPEGFRSWSTPSWWSH